MKTSIHLIVSAILAAIFYPDFGLNVFWIFVGGVVVDIDHYFWYFYKEKKYSLFGCYDYFMGGSLSERTNKVRGCLLVFHTIEFVIILAFMMVVNPIAMMIMIGLLPHYIMDLINYYMVAGRFIANHSITRWVLQDAIFRHKSWPDG